MKFLFFIFFMDVASTPYIVVIYLVSFLPLFFFFFFGNSLLFEFGVSKEVKCEIIEIFIVIMNVQWFWKIEKGRDLLQ